MIEVIVLAISLVLVACFAAAETSFVTADKVALVVNRGSRFQFKSAFYFLRNNEVFFATVVVASNIFITIFSSLAEITFHEKMRIGMSVVLPVTTFIGFLFGELIPKSVALESPESVTRILLPFVRLFYFVAQPAVKFTASVSTYIAKIFFHSSPQSAVFQKRDVYRFLGDTVGSGYLDKIESDIIRRLLANAGLPVRNVAVPRTQIVAAKLGTGIEKIREIFEKTGKTKVIIYDVSIDNIVGVVHAKDIFRDVETAEQIISDVLFVPENITVVDLLEEFRAEKVYAAILIDEFGGTAGLVTSSDIMELFLGDVAIWASEEKIKRIGNKQFMLHGNTEIAELESNLKMKIPKGDFTTIAGLVISQVGRIPLQGEKIYIDGHEFRVVESDGRKVETLKLTLK